MLDRGAEGEEFAHRIPAQVAFFLELLHVLGRRAASAGFEQAAAGHQRHDRQHLRAGAEFEDREEVGQVVAQHVAGDGNGVQPGADAFQRETCRIDRREDAQIETVGVVILQVTFDLLDELRVVRALAVEPEDGRRAGSAGALHGEFYPVLDRRVLGLAHAEDVAGFDRLFEQDLAAGVDNAHGAARLQFEGLVVRTVFLGGLRHQADVGYAAHGLRIECAMLLAVFDRGLVEGGITAVGDDRLGVVQLAVGAPHLARLANHRRHRGVDNHVARHVQISDALVRIDHRQRGAGGQAGLKVGFQRGFLRLGQCGDLGQ